jgi:hypothetical protein
MLNFANGLAMPLVVNRRSLRQFASGETHTHGAQCP